MARGSMNSHISQFPTAPTRKDTRTARAHVVILSGEGYSLSGPKARARRYEWQVGTMIVPPKHVVHQHFNTGTAPARYLASSTRPPQFAMNKGGPRRDQQAAWRDQIDYADEQPAFESVYRGARQAQPQAADGRGYRRNWASSDQGALTRSDRVWRRSGFSGTIRRRRLFGQEF